MLLFHFLTDWLTEIIAILTYGGVSNECFLVLQHGIDGKFFAILRGDDGNRWLLVGRNGRHLFDDFNLLIVVMYTRERVELHRFDKTTLLQQEHYLKYFFLIPSVVPREQRVE